MAGNDLTNDDVLKALQEQLSKKDMPKAADMSFKEFKSEMTTSNFTRAMANAGSGEAPNMNPIDFDAADKQDQTKRLAQSLNAEHKGDSSWKALDESGKMTPEIFKEVQRLRDEYDSAGLSASQQKAMLAVVAEHGHGETKGQDLTLDQVAKKAGIDPNDKHAANLALIKEYKQAENYAHSIGSVDGELQYKDSNYKQLDASSSIMDKETRALIAERTADFDKAHPNPTVADNKHPKLVIDADPNKVLAGDQGEIQKLKGEVAGHSRQELDQYAKEHGINGDNLKKIEVAAGIPADKKPGGTHHDTDLARKDAPATPRHTEDVASFVRDVEAKGQTAHQDKGLAGQEVVAALKSTGADVSELEANLAKKGAHGVVDDAVMKKFMEENDSKKVLAALEKGPAPHGDPGIGGDHPTTVAKKDDPSHPDLTKVDVKDARTPGINPNDNPDLQKLSEIVAGEKASLEKAGGLGDLLKDHKALLATIQSQVTSDTAFIKDVTEGKKGLTADDIKEHLTNLHQLAEDVKTVTTANSVPNNKSQQPDRGMPA